MSGFSDALDHHETVAALTAAITSQYGQTFTDAEVIASQITTGLARLGYAVISLEPVTDRPLGQEAATSWFGHEEEAR